MQQIKTMKREREDQIINQSEEENGEEEEHPRKREKLVSQSLVATECPYLDTINRKVLDFDFEKLCSVSLLNVNIYACLVCGKYFQGKGANTPAFTHSLNEDHHVFINLHNCKIYCLPDSYEILDHTLSDIKYNLNPTYTKESIKQIDERKK